MITNIVAMLILLVLLVGLILLTSRVRQGANFTLRPLPGFVVARQAISRSAEYGRPIHISPGPGGIGDSTTSTAETLAGINLVGVMAQECAVTGTPVLITTGDALSFTLAENVVRAGYANVGRLGDAPVGPGNGAASVRLGQLQGVRMLAHRDPLAFAAAATDISENEQLLNSTTVGGWGREYLLLGESQQRRKVESVAGATSPEALAVMMLSADHTLIGEEMFAAGAYIQQRPAHIASLWAQDYVRLIILAAIVLGVVIATLAGRSIPEILGIG